MVDRIKNLLEDALEAELHFALGNIDALSESTPTIDAYRLTASSYRLVTNLMQTYSDLIIEMIASVYNYSIVSFFVLDTKFVVWKAWLEALTALYRFYIIDPRINGHLKDIVLHLTEQAAKLYVELLQSKKDYYGDQGKLIDLFLKMHKKTYQTFYGRLISILNKAIASDLDALNQLQQLAFEIAMWMQYTTFEVISLDRCLFGDKKVIVSGVVVAVYRETGLNLVKQFEEIGITDFEVQFTTPDLLEYKHLFLTKKEKVEVA